MDRPYGGRQLPQPSVAEPSRFDDDQDATMDVQHADTGTPTNHAPRHRPLRVSVLLDGRWPDYFSESVVIGDEWS